MMQRIVLSVVRNPLLKMVSGTGSVGTFRRFSVFEPDDLERAPDIPEYDLLNIRMRGYDFVTLESFAKYVHNTARLFDLDATVWAVPSRSTNLKTYRPFSTNVVDAHLLRKYERTVQISDIPTTRATVFIEVLQHHLPEGVEMTVKEPEEEEEEFRYVPDVMLEIMQGQIDELEKAKDDRKK